MSKLPPAGNNVGSLQPKAPLTPAVIEARDKALAESVANTLEHVQAKAATTEAAKQPVPSATHPPTGPSPVEFAEPIRGGKSTAGPAPIVHEAITVHAPAKGAVSTTPSLAERVTLLENRLADFNKRSGQKI